MRNFIQEYMVSSQYFAPRGKERLMFLGEQISHRHLNYSDRLIGIVGDAGAGKSSLIKGMFPGLQLSNDDDIVNPRKIMQVRNSLLEVEDATTFHIDVRFQMAFTQMYEIVDYV
ncbi:MAG: alanine-tRNA synthetase second additional domain-containing protein, partial [Petrimonas sp.]|nr:alanine-tRNA synthetase second additional domain-containing protein [Petrimonas sp.]